MEFTKAIMDSKEFESLNIPEENIWEAYGNHKFWCQQNAQYPMDWNSFFGDYQFNALALHRKGGDVLDKALLDPLHGFLDSVTKCNGF